MMAGNEDERAGETLDYGRAATHKRAPLWARTLGVLVGLLLLFLSLNGLLWLHADLLDVSLVSIILLAGVLVLWMSISGRAIGRKGDKRRND